ncbi:MAG: hypothetical protein IPN14_05820 [Bacteroidetes bacterium]|nr:hypothetical protein [Bacteroidota bacterium]
MKSFLISLFALLSITFSLQAQNWTGAVSSNWDDPNNWSPANVPNANSAVNITNVGNSPQLQSNVTIGVINANTGVVLDFNGYSMTITSNTGGYKVFNGVTFNNTNAGSDIVLNMNTGGSGYYATFDACTINDKITFNLSGDNAFYEGSTANQYNGDVVYNVSSGMATFLSYAAASQYAGNFSFVRTVGGTSIILGSGATIGGNFSLQNVLGGIIRIGHASIPTNVGGTCNINAVYPAADEFVLRRFKNQTNGGSIYVQNSRAFDIQDDTLNVSSMTFQGYGPYGYALFLHNKLIGNLSIEDDANFGSGYNTSINDNHITGNTTVTIHGSNALYEASNANEANSYIGNTVFNLNSGAPAYISHLDKSMFNGNLSILRTVAGYTRAFNAGADINGNFIFNNATSGDNDLGNLTNLTLVSGTVNMNINLSPIGNFNLLHFNNQTAGGKINVFNTRGFNIQNDSLLVDSLNVMYYTGSAYSLLTNNLITAHVTIADSANYGGGYVTSIQNNTINGNTKFRSSSSNGFYEAQGANMQNIFNGHLIFDVVGAASVFVSLDAKSTINGNFTFNRTTAGYSSLFNAGVDLTGNFSFVKNGSGGTSIGNLNSKTSIGGTININATQTTDDIFNIHRVQNYTNGGSINLQSIRGMSILQDTLLLTSLNITGYGGQAYAYFYDNFITGNVTTQDDPGYTNGYITLLQNNTINGNSEFNNLGFNSFIEANTANLPNTFNGNVIFNANNSGGLFVSHEAQSVYNGNLSINRNAGGYTRIFNFGGQVNGNFSYIKNAAGASEIGNIGLKTTIGGTLTMAVTQTLSDNFNIFWLQNGTAGGDVNILNTKAINFQKDSFKVNTLSITNNGGVAYTYFLNNKVEGNFNFVVDSSYGLGYLTFIEKNTITGNTTFTNNGSNEMLDGNAAESGNTYLGNTTYTRTGGLIHIGNGDTNSYGGNLIFNSSLPINANQIQLTGNANTTIDQMNTADITIQKLIMNKNSNANVTLQKPVKILNSCHFISGDIISQPVTPLIFLDNTTQNAANDNSHIVGSALKIGDDVFSFPLGNGSELNSISITAPSTVNDSILANLFIQHPDTDGYFIASKDPTLINIAPYHYWTLNRISGSNPLTVQLGWGTPCVSAGITDLPTLAVARWNGSSWENLGNSATTGSPVNGTVTMSGTTTNFGPFALASTSNLNQWITTITASNTPICAGDSTVLTATGAITYTWMPGNLSGNIVTVNPLATTTYTVTGTGAFGCITTATKTIDVLVIPTLTASTTNDVICTGASTTITVNGANTYSWQPGSLTGASNIVSPPVNTVYTITGTHANGCTNTVTQMITVGDCAPCGTDIVISTSPYSILLTESTTYIETNGTVMIDSGAYVKFDAAPTSYVLLKPGFMAKYGSVFIAQAFNGCTAGSPQLPQNKMAGLPAVNNEEEGIFIYPNPTTGKITIEHPASLKEAFILDLMGKKVRQLNLSSENKSDIDISDLPNGVYIFYAAGYTNFKIIKN